MTIVNRHIRTCQSCFYQQIGRDPSAEPKIKEGSKEWDKWVEAKCKKCGSPDLDYGSEMQYNLETKEVVELNIEDEE